MEYSRATGSITNKVYRELNDVSHETAARALRRLVKDGLLTQQGQGRSSMYVLTETARGARKVDD